MDIAASLLGGVVRRNNARARWVDPISRNPRRPTDAPWHQTVAAHLPAITTEWDAFADSGGRLPHIEDLLGEDQGNVGPWRVGLLLSGSRSTVLGRTAFPRTLAALGEIPGLRAGLLSVLDPGTELTAHHGPNAGVLRYHLGIRCPRGSALQVGETEVPYVDGGGILFDDTAEHAAWNRSEHPRVTLFCELDRPLPMIAAARNRMVQNLLAADPRRRAIVDLADDWHRSLNRRSTAGFDA